MTKTLFLIVLVAPLFAQPTLPNAVPAPQPEVQYFDTDGTPLASGKLCTYAANSSTPLATYTDSTAGTPNTNPVTLDAAGRASIWVGPRLYKFVLRKGGTAGSCSDGSVIWTQDNVADTTLYFTNYVKTVGSSTLISYTNPASGAISRTQYAKNNDVLSVKDFGAVGDGSTDDEPAFTAAIAVSTLTQCIYVPDGIYAINTALFSNHPICLTGNEWRLKYTGAPTAYVLKLQGGDASVPHNGFMEGSYIQGAVFDGQGNTIDGLLLQGVVSAQMNYLRATNVTGHGFACAWCQQVTFEHVMVSADFENFTTVPSGGVLLDLVSVANHFIQINIDHVSANGIDLLYGFNNIFTGGTSEGNGGLAVYCKGLASPFTQCLNNTFTNLDTEENTGGDYVFEGIGASFNTITSTNSFSSASQPGIVFKTQANTNTVLGGFMGIHSSAEASTFGNALINVSCTKTGTCWTDNGQNINTRIYNKGDGTFQDAQDNYHSGQIFRHSAAASHAVEVDTTGDTTAFVRVGNPAGGFAGIYCDSGFTACWLNYTITGGLTFMSETTPEHDAAADGAIKNHNWGWGSFMSNPVYKFHFLDGSISTVVVQNAPGQGTNNLVEFRDKVTNSSTIFSAVTWDGQWNGPIKATSTVGGGAAGFAMCKKSDSTIGYCSTVVASDGTCTCN